MWVLDACTKRCLHLTGVTEVMYTFMVQIVMMLFMALWILVALLAQEPGRREGFHWLLRTSPSLCRKVYLSSRSLVIQVDLLLAGIASVVQSSLHAAQKFRFGIHLASCLETPPAATPSIPDEEPALPPPWTSRTPRVPGGTPMTNRPWQRSTTRDCACDL